MNILASGFSKALSAFSRSPLSFVWASFFYVVLLAVVSFAAIGIFLIYFMITSVAEQPVLNPAPSIPTIVVLVLLGLFVSLCSAGLSGALTRAYREAMNGGKKTSMADFYGYMLRCAPMCFSIALIRDVFSAFFIVPAAVIYSLYLSTTGFADVVVGLFILFVSFIAHMGFAPAFISAGTGLETNLLGALKRGLRVLTSKHVYFLLFYVLFAFVWLLCFVPIIQIIAIFALLPIAYSALITFVEL